MGNAYYIGRVYNKDHYYNIKDNEGKTCKDYLKENEKDESKIYHIYIGEFQDNKKSGEGAYFKIKKFEQEKEKENVPIDFVFEVGYFSVPWFWRV